MLLFFKCGGGAVFCGGVPCHRNNLRTLYSRIGDG